MFPLIYIVTACVVLLVSCNPIETGQFFVKTSGASNEDGDDNQQNVISEEFFSCNAGDTCSRVSKKSGKSTEIWEKARVFLGLPRYVIPRDGTGLIRMKWLTARKYCVSMGADLLSISSPAEQSKVSKFVQESGVVEHIWIGLNDRENENKFVWSDGSHLTYENWREGQPDNSHGVEHCVEMHTAPWKWKWNDRSCDDPLSFICKFDI